MKTDILSQFSLPSEMPKAAALAEVVGYRLRRLQAIWIAHWGQTIRRLGLEVTPMQGGVLMLIGDNPGIGHAALARLLSVEAPTLSQTLNPLVEAGLVDRVRSARDGRAVALNLSKAGARATGIVSMCSRAHEGELLAGLSDTERQDFLALLDKAVASAAGAFEENSEKLR